MNTQVEAQMDQGVDELLQVTFYGVRGSTPCPCDANHRYGGNTSCVALEAPGQIPIIFDLGTGLRLYGQAIGGNRPFQGAALVTHLHWDHVQGLPFFVPILRDGARFDIYGPPSGDQSLEDSFRTFVSPPFFPVGIDDLPGAMHFHDRLDQTFEVGRAEVLCRQVPHVGVTAGFRVNLDGVSVAYISDHQMPLDGTTIADGVRELVDGVDLLIHDAQYTPEEFAVKSTWGHCTVDYAVHVAAECGAKRLALFHHDPAHDDAEIDSLAKQAAESAVGRVDEVIAAVEGLALTF